MVQVGMEIENEGLSSRSTIDFCIVLIQDMDIIFTIPVPRAIPINSEREFPSDVSDVSRLANHDGSNCKASQGHEFAMSFPGSCIDLEWDTPTCPKLVPTMRFVSLVDSVRIPFNVLVPTGGSLRFHFHLHASLKRLVDATLWHHVRVRFEWLSQIGTFRISCREETTTFVDSRIDRGADESTACAGVGCS